jgi:hypothetical protein
MPGGAEVPQLPVGQLPSSNPGGGSLPQLAKSAAARNKAVAPAMFSAKRRGRQAVCVE